MARGSVEAVRSRREVVVERESEQRVWEADFHWRVSEFSSMPGRVDFCCWSPDFDFCGRRWCLYLRPNGRSGDQSEGSFLLSLTLADSEPAVDVRYSLGIGTAQGEMVAWKTETHTFGSRNYIVRARGMRRSEVFRRRDQLLPGDVLTVIVTLQLKEGGASRTGVKDVSVQTEVECIVADTSVEAAMERSVADTSVEAAMERSVADVSVQAVVADDVENERNEDSIKTGGDKILEDIGRLWPSGEYGDVLLTVKHVQFKAHKTILVARTPALGAMFQHNTVEKASGEVKIEDCDPEVFEELLYYIYKGAPNVLTSANACSLFVLADKYLVTELKRLCVQCMQDSLCLDAFCDTLTLSLIYREDELLKTVTDFFSRNMVHVMKTVQWQRFMREHMTWANEIQIRAVEMIQARCEEEKRAVVDQNSVPSIN